MEQSIISKYFPLKKRRNDSSHASIKKRKLSETSSLDILQSSSDIPAIPHVGQINVKTPALHTRRKRTVTKKLVSNTTSEKSLLPLCKTLSPCKASLKTDSSCNQTDTPPSSSALSSVSRGAALVRLAQEKSPVKSREITIQFSHKIKRAEPQDELVHKISAKELAAPTEHEKRPSPSIKEFRCIEVESPKKDKDRTPAYMRFHSLAEPTTEPEPLPLPHSYQLLSEKFQCADTVVNMLQKRGEIAAFSKVKRAVEKMSRRDFEQRNFAQMKTVYPTAFMFRQEGNIPGSLNSKSQLTVECNTDDPSGSLGPTALIKRRKVFRQGLVSLVKDHHRQFLSKLHPPLTIPDVKVLRWHPEFSLDQLPDIPESPLPQPPIKERVSGATDVLRAAQSRLAPRVQSALVNSSSKASCADQREEATPACEQSTDPALRGVSQALLDKIRAKEAARARLKITRDPVKEKQLEMVARLPEFIRILRGFFVGEKKAALLWNEVVSKLCDSTLSKLSPECVGEHLSYLSELAPSWLTPVTIKKKKYVKLNKKTDVKAVLDIIHRTKNRLSSPL